MRLSLLAPLALIVSLAACSTDPGASLAKPAESIGTEQECTARGGEWKQLGRAPVQQCLLKTADAGKACSDSRECEGQCLAAEGTTDGTTAPGQCSVDNNAFGCQTRLRDGVASTICVD